MQSHPQARQPLARAFRELARAATWHRRWLAAGLMAASVAFAISAATPARPPMVGAVAAAHDVPAGAVLKPADLRLVRVPDGLLPAGTQGTVREVAGRVLGSPIGAGEIVTDARLVGAGLLAGYGDAMVAAPVRIADATAAGLLRTGDVVDVLAAGAAPGSDGQPPEARLVAAAVRVIAVARAADQAFGADGLGEGALVLLATSSETARRLATAAAFARLSVTIRAA
ncbi:MAG: hypothetical protein QOJ49_326 [Actinomycetota bacterium]|jgi:Flp pilus assembly protein CpaB|nr:hypothetical protein [Actinomycetota bacterium]